MAKHRIVGQREEDGEADCTRQRVVADVVLHVVKQLHGRRVLARQPRCDALVAQRRRRLHSDWVSVAAFSPDGKTVVTGSDDSTAKLWDVISHVAKTETVTRTRTPTTTQRIPLHLVQPTLQARRCFASTSARDADHRCRTPAWRMIRVNEDVPYRRRRRRRAASSRRPPS